jgi:SAM-dependent methyltransferase
MEVTKAMISISINSCRLCNSSDLDIILDLGAQPPANSLRVDVIEQLEKVPLIICRCRQCTTVQLTETVSPEHLFRDYVWVTGTSQTAREYSYRFYDSIELRCEKRPLFVIEVASNDGTFLQRFREKGHRVLGVDPAQNLARAAEEAGINTLDEFFSLEIAKQVVQKHGQADAVMARNVLPHVPDPNDVVAGIVHCLKVDGVGAIEFHWIEKILSELHYDSLYHEHFFYHSLHSINELLKRHQLFLFDVTESPISGGSLVAYFSRTPRHSSPALMEKMALEDERGLAKLVTWQEFARRSIEHSLQLKEMVEDELGAGRKVIGYGASARSSTLLNFSGLDSQHLSYIADQSPLKHGRYTPGTNVLVVSPERALAEYPDTILLLAWNFRDEILKELTKAGFHGNIIVPLPNSPQLLKV